MKAKAAKRVREAKARAALVGFGVPVEVNAVDALLGELHRSAGMVEWVQRQLGLVPRDMSGLVSDVRLFSADVDRDVTAELGEAAEAGHGPSLMVRESTESGYRFVENPLVAIYRAERKHLVDVAKVCVSLGLREIEVQAFVSAVRAEAGQVVELLRAVVADPELTDVADRVRAVVVRQLEQRRGVPQ